MTSSATASASPLTAPARSAGRAADLARSFAALLRRSPVALVFALVLIATAIVTGTVTGPPSAQTSASWAAGVTTTIDAGRWWTVGSALVVPWDPFQLVAGVLAALILGGVAERLLGPVRLLVALVVTGVVGVAGGVLLQAVGSLAGEWWADGTAADLTLDPLTALVGAFLAASAFASALWRRRMRIVTVAAILVFALYDGDSSNVYRLLAAATGLLLGALFARDTSTLRWHRSSHTEVRALLATVVAVTAIGPVVSLINPSETSLLGLVSQLFAMDGAVSDDVIAQCATQETAFCDTAIALAGISGPGPVILTFVPLLLLLAGAWGMRRGRRFALWLVLAVELSLTVLSFFAFDVVHTVGEGSGQPFSIDIGEYILLVLSATLLPLAIAILLWVNRRHFAVRAPRKAVVRFVAITATAYLVLAGVWLLTALLAFGTFIPSVSHLELLADVPRRFLPPHYVGTAGEVFIPGEELALVIFRWVGPLFWLVVLVAIVQLFRTTSLIVRAGDHGRLRELLHRGGGGTLAFMATWPGNVYWFSPDRKGAVAYRVINDIAITMSDPICADADRRGVVRGFAAWCEANSWTPVFYSAHEECLPVFDELGWSWMSVGEETLVHPPTFELAGKPWQKVRQALNKGIKEGMTTVWTTWRDLPIASENQIRQISEQWVSEKELPEMSFTLGGMAELDDPEVALMLAVDPDGRIQAVTSWLPSYRDGRVVGWTLDFMRRADDSMNGIMEFLIASAALHMKEQGVEVLSLSGAPLASKPVPAGEQTPAPTAMSRLLEFLAKTLEPAYGFSSLFRFKAKFNPTYETLYMSYPDPLALPAIGTAIGKAYLPDASAKEYLALARTLTVGKG